MIREDRSNDAYCSAASIGDIALKNARGRKGVRVNLIAESIAEPFTRRTHDAMLGRYRVAVRVV